ncbi:MAG: phytoene desaturase [Flavobacteriales bacterium]|nr:phytoene desaturase [Flavobacteriales bacterium]
MSKVAVIGSGFSSLSAACFLSKDGHDVHVFEQQDHAGGRARQWKEDGFTFDMGPSWYWMPDVFERFFNQFGKTASDFYQLDRLDPSYRVYFAEKDFEDLPADLSELKALFDTIEAGSGQKLQEFLDEGKVKYEVGMQQLVFKPSLSPMEFVESSVIKNAPRLSLLKSFTTHARKYFTNERLLELISFPVLFLGAKPENTPALYSLMNYADMALGTWYPQGGMHEIVKAMKQVADDQGVNFHFNSKVERLNVSNGRIESVRVNGEDLPFDAVLAGADYHHVESRLLEPQHRSYSEKYWSKKTMAPSCLIYYLGIDKKCKNLEHHNLFFDSDFHQHAIEIYDEPQWPENPLFYVCCPSKTDKTVAPEGKENLFFLIPVAPGIEDTDDVRERYFEMMLDRLNAVAGEDIRNHIVVKRSYCINDFIEDYNAFKGNAYGLANTLRQTAFLKPKIKSKKVSNLYFAGQLTAPGPGVPPSLISGEISAKELTSRTQ